MKKVTIPCLAGPVVPITCCSVTDFRRPAGLVASPQFAIASTLWRSRFSRRELPGSPTHSRHKGETMADKKLTVAEILAAARKADAPGGAAEAPKAEAAADAADAPPAAEKPAAPAAKKPAAGGGRPSVAEMLAMARGEKAGGAAPPPPKKSRPRSQPPRRPKPRRRRKKRPPAKSRAGRYAKHSRRRAQGCEARPDDQGRSAGEGVAGRCRCRRRRRPKKRSSCRRCR